MLKKIFISRFLSKQSPFWNFFNQEEVEAFSLLTFTAQAFTKPTQCDWLFFYSKMGVKFFFQKHPEIPVARCAAFGSASGAVLAQYTSVQFIGNGKASATAAGLKVIMNERDQICFVTAKHSVHSMRIHFPSANRIITYENAVNKDWYLDSDFEILVFTSPLNVESYFNKRTFLANQKFVAIGNTTADALRNLGIENVEISEEPTEKSLAKKAWQLWNAKS